MPREFPDRDKLNFAYQMLAEGASGYAVGKRLISTVWGSLISPVV
jgi:hypothetical protein